MSTMPTDRPVLRLSTPQDVLDTIPYLLGFHPTDSLVLIGLKGDRRRVGITMRCDLDMGSLPGAMRRLSSALLDDGCDQAIGVLYAPDVITGTAWADTIRSYFPSVGISIRELMRVNDGRWYSYMCQDPACCPIEGTQILDDDKRVAATAVVAGMVAESSRDDLVARLLPPSQSTRNQARTRFAMMSGAPDEADLTLIRELIGRFAIERTPYVTPRELARTAYTMGDFHMRDEVLTWALDTERALAMQRLLLEVVRTVGERESVPAATVLAAVYYLGGQGAMARVLMDHVEAYDPQYSLALLIGKMLDHGIHPSRLHEVIQATRDQLHPDGI